MLVEFSWLQMDQSREREMGYADPTPEQLLLHLKTQMRSILDSEPFDTGTQSALITAASRVSSVAMGVE